VNAGGVAWPFVRADEGRLVVGLNRGAVWRRGRRCERRHSFAARLITSYADVRIVRSTAPRPCPWGRRKTGLQETGAEIEVHAVLLVDESPQPFITLTDGLPTWVLRSARTVLRSRFLCWPNSAARARWSSTVRFSASFASSRYRSQSPMIGRPRARIARARHLTLSALRGERGRAGPPSLLRRRLWHSASSSRSGRHRPRECPERWCREDCRRLRHCR
jgi:hypothetical protein